ncbi:MAG: hypothetical protein KGQ40_05235, partial [Rhodospirillales bacterium]|nr:hypothetical protein [Rhodospirillales bacterium]
MRRCEAMKPDFWQSIRVGLLWKSHCRELFWYFLNRIYYAAGIKFIEYGERPFPFAPFFAWAVLKARRENPAAPDGVGWPQAVAEQAVGWPSGPRGVRAGSSAALR